MTTKAPKTMQTTVVRSLRLGIAFTVIYAISIAIFKAWRLLTVEVIQQRLVLLIALVIIHVSLLALAHKRYLNATNYVRILWLQIITFLLLASYFIYSERGMASNSVILFVIPIIMSSLCRQGKKLVTATVLAATMYSATAITYFRHYPSEGYKVELYGGIVFYCSIIFVIAALLWVLIKTKK